MASSAARRDRDGMHLLTRTPVRPSSSSFADEDDENDFLLVGSFDDDDDDDGRDRVGE
jgi:hypothetical protein